MIARPSLMIGNRASLGQPERPLEKVSAGFMKIFGMLIPANYRAIDAAKVARTLLARTPSGERSGRGASARARTDPPLLSKNDPGGL